MITSVVPLPQRIEPCSFLDGSMNVYNIPGILDPSLYQQAMKFRRGRMLNIPNTAFIRLDAFIGGYLSHAKTKDMYAQPFRTEHVFAIDRRALVDYAKLSVQGTNGAAPLLGVPISVKVIGGEVTRTYLFRHSIEYLINHLDMGSIDLLNPPNDLADDPTRLQRVPPVHLLTLNQFLDKITHNTTPSLAPICNALTPDAPRYIAEAIECADRIIDADPSIPCIPQAINNLIGLLDENLDHSASGMTLEEFIGGPLLSICDTITSACLASPVVNLQQFQPYITGDIYQGVNNAVYMAEHPLQDNVHIDPTPLDPKSDFVMRFIELVRMIPYDYYSISTDRARAGGRRCYVQTPVSSFDIDGSQLWCGDMIVSNMISDLYDEFNFSEEPNLKAITLMKTALDEIWLIREMMDGYISARHLPMAIAALVSPSLIDDFIW